MSRRLTRRRFLQDSAALPVGLGLTGTLAADAKKAPPSETVNVGVIGVAGRGGENLHGVVGAGANIVALCDVDTERAGPARSAHPQAKFYQDFRRLLEQKDIDAVVVSTPDHMHA